MIFERFTNIFIEIFSVIAVIVAIPLAIVLMPFILIGAVTASCFDRFHDYAEDLEYKKRRKEENE